MTESRSGTISLNEVDQYTADALPLIDQVTTSDSQTIDELLAKNPDLEIFVADSVKKTIASLRRDPARPGTVLHALMLADSLSVGAMAGRMHVDPRTGVKPDLERLVEAGVVNIDSDSPEGLAKYSMSSIALASAFSAAKAHDSSLFL